MLTCTLTASPRGAISLAEMQESDLVLADINMPEMSGFDMATLLNGDSARRWTQVIFKSSSNDGRTMRDAFGVGAVDYLVKPFTRGH